ncbi:nucleoside-triphosphatase THEP1 [Ochrobactrum daejeonense]|uniref:Nucleoside-triphosphatase THEP1 n=1 Tax=Brucella daejeonensis TaxID=659015 RepID=A0A7W9AWU9_9HYPH|nr:DUF2478 domain-containing protein [Brucella daejeonensis]MBB5702080.1 nucleoside-triphosphatase THEP1 [Brucella daejeonensis]NKB80042.1 DUF2478 domain-containing protein [Brucella daejeonensis]
MNSDRPILAAILAAKDLPVDHLLTLAAERAAQSGLRVAGFIQHRDRTDKDECCRDIHIEHIGTGMMQIISQSLGSGSKGCRLDPQALAEVAGGLLAELDAGANILILNRFGKGETEGHGFRTVIETAFARQIPVLTVVRETYADGWRDFAGDCGVVLLPDSKAVLGWFDGVTESRQLPEAV